MRARNSSCSSRERLFGRTRAAASLLRAWPCARPRDGRGRICARVRARIRTRRADCAAAMAASARPRALAAAVGRGARETRRAARASRGDARPAAGSARADTAAATADGRSLCEHGALADHADARDEPRRAAGHARATQLRDRCARLIHSTRLRWTAAAARRVHRERVARTVSSLRAYVDQQDALPSQLRLGASSTL